MCCNGILTRSSIRPEELQLILTFVVVFPTALLPPTYIVKHTLRPSHWTRPLRHRSPHLPDGFGFYFGRRRGALNEGNVPSVQLQRLIGKKKRARGCSHGEESETADEGGKGNSIPSATGRKVNSGEAGGGGRAALE